MYSHFTLPGRYDKAKKYYSKAKDYLSLVRIACFKVSRSL
jgi:hypothetical protein